MRWNDKIGMLAQSTQLVKAVFRETADFCVVGSLAPGTTDRDEFLLSNSNVYDSMLCNSSINDCWSLQLS